jgi:hypothetical protein
MEEATKSAHLVREDIQSFRNRFTFISSDETCEVCNVTLMIRPFYMFPCQHKFHTDCLMNELNPLLGKFLYHIILLAKTCSLSYGGFDSVRENRKRNYFMKEKIKYNMRHKHNANTYLFKLGLLTNGTVKHKHFFFP